MKNEPTLAEFGELSPSELRVLRYLPANRYARPQHLPASGREETTMTTARMEGSCSPRIAPMLPEHRLVALDDTSGRVLGWVAMTRTSSRPAYAGVAEHSVYVYPAARGQGVGLALLTALIAATEAAGLPDRP
jgi:L-amino acid N-acyltransferase YncA